MCKMFYPWERTVKYYSNAQMKQKIEDDEFDRKENKGDKDTLSTGTAKTSKTSISKDPKTKTIG